MFTGIVSGVGTVIEAGSSRLGIRHSPTAKHLKVGASVAVNGCCLTVVAKRRDAFFADVVPETKRRTNLGRLTPGASVNLELPLAADGRMDGHFVQGHVDSRARVRSVRKAAAGSEVTFELPRGLRNYIVEKGSIAVDGMSLTVAGVNHDAGTFKVALIPHTLAVTIAGTYAGGSVVNLEADVIARYVARNLHR